VDPEEIEGVDPQQLEEQATAVEVLIAAALVAVAAAAASQIGIPGLPSLPSLPGIGLPPVADVDALSVIPTLWSERLDGQIMPAVGRAIRSVSQRMQTELKAIMPPGLPEVPPIADVTSAQLMAQARNRLVNIGDELWENARDSLVEGLERGETIPELTARVRAAAGVTEPRARTIARTEVISVSNQASIAQARSAGVPLDKIWQSTEDLRTRAAHVEADGQQVPLDGMFEVGGELLDIPGDPSGRADNIINCRCAVRFRLAAPVTAGAWHRPALNCCREAKNGPGVRGWCKGWFGDEGGGLVTTDVPVVAAGRDYVRDGEGKFSEVAGGVARTGALGSVLDKLEVLRGKLGDDDRGALEEAMAQLRGLESSDVDDDDLIEDEPEAEEEAEEEDLVMESANGELSFYTYANGTIDVDLDGTNQFDLSPSSAQEVADAVANFAALPTVEVPERPELPDWVKSEDDFVRWTSEWYESAEWQEYGAVAGEVVTSDEKLKVRRFNSGVVQIGDPDSVDAEDEDGVVQLDDPDESREFAEMLRRAMEAATVVTAGAYGGGCGPGQHRMPGGMCMDDADMTTVITTAAARRYKRDREGKFAKTAGQAVAEIDDLMARLSALTQSFSTSSDDETSRDSAGSAMDALKDLRREQVAKASRRNASMDTENHGEIDVLIHGDGDVGVSWESGDLYAPPEVMRELAAGIDELRANGTPGRFDTEDGTLSVELFSDCVSVV